MIPTVSGRGRKCYEKGAAAEIFWDAIPDADMKACRTIAPFNPNLWNKEVDGAWRRDLGDYDYGLK